MVSISEAEKLVEQKIAQGAHSAAAKLLYQMIVHCAKQKKFAKAEKLRNWLLEADPMALNEIIRSQEIIDEEKEQALDPIHTEIWSKLYDQLDTEEKNALYYSMQDATYRTNQTIFSQGDLAPHLYFIDQGHIKLIYTHKDGEFLLGTLGMGQVAGQDNFFSNTICTTSALAASNVKVKFIEKSILEEWENDFPNLKKKLHDFCSEFQSVIELLEKKQMDRRMQKRVKISGIGLFSLLNQTGVPIAKSFKGELTDISVGGLAFDIRISKEETARLLLGRKLNAKYNFTRSHPNIEIDRDGTIVGIYPYPFEDYSIHVKFDHKLTQNVVDIILRNVG